MISVTAEAYRKIAAAYLWAGEDVPAALAGVLEAAGVSLGDLDPAPLAPHEGLAAGESFIKRLYQKLPLMGHSRPLENRN